MPSKSSLMYYVTIDSGAAKCGGQLSQGFIGAEINRKGGECIYFKPSPFKEVLLFCLTRFFRKKSAAIYPFLHGFEKDNIKGILKRYLNHFVMSGVISNYAGFQNETIVMDAYLPAFTDSIRKETGQSTVIYSVVRSAPHCFAWITMPDRLLFFADQLRFTDGIICASTDVADMWMELIGQEKRIIEMPTPFLDSENKQSVNAFFDQEAFNIVLIVGSVGPRKGVWGALRAVQNSCKKTSTKVVVHVFGAISEPSRYHEESKDSKNLIVRFHGFVKVDLNNIQKNNVLFIFSSFSECFSRAQMEILAQGVPILVNRYGVDSKFLKLLQDESVYSNTHQLKEKVDVCLNDGACGVAQYLPTNFEKYKAHIDDQVRMGLDALFND